MAFSFPVSKGDFIKKLRVRSTKFHLNENFQESRGAGGFLLRQEIAEPYWTAEITLSNMPVQEAREASAYMRRIGVFGSFYMVDFDHRYPASDPTGSQVSGNTVTIDNISGDRRSCRFEGLPGGYRLTWGDRFHINYASGRRGYFEVSDEVTANGSGVTPTFEVTPSIWFGITNGDTVQLAEPSAKMMLQTYDPGQGEMLYRAGASFSAIETI